MLYHYNHFNIYLKPQQVTKLRNEVKTICKWPYLQKENFEFKVLMIQ